MNSLPNKQYDLRKLNCPGIISKDSIHLKPQKENKVQETPILTFHKKTCSQKLPTQIRPNKSNFETKKSPFSAEKLKSTKSINRKIRKSKSRNCISKKKENWTDEEDTVLLSLVRKYGPKNWTEIATHFNHRLGKQCRERWFNHLSPDVKKSKWTEQEDLILLHAYIEFGSRWSVISTFLAGRTDNSVKNHYNSTIKRKLKNNELDFTVSPIKFDICQIDNRVLPLPESTTTDLQTVLREMPCINLPEIGVLEVDALDQNRDSPVCRSVSAEYQIIAKEDKQVPETAVSALKIRFPLINPNLLENWEGPSLLNELLQKSESKCRENMSPKLVSFGDLLESLRNVTVDLLSFKEF